MALELINNVAKNKKELQTTTTTATMWFLIFLESSSFKAQARHKNSESSSNEENSCGPNLILNSAAGLPKSSKSHLVVDKDELSFTSSDASGSLLVGVPTVLDEDDDDKSERAEECDEAGRALDKKIEKESDSINASNEMFPQEAFWNMANNLQKEVGAKKEERNDEETCKDEDGISKEEQKTPESNASADNKDTTTSARNVKKHHLLHTMFLSVIVLVAFVMACLAGGGDNNVKNCNNFPENATNCSSSDVLVDHYDNVMALRCRRHNHNSKKVQQQCHVHLFTALSLW